MKTSVFAKPLRIMPLGDSTTVGVFRDGKAPGGYRTRLHHRLSTEMSPAIGVEFVGSQCSNPDPGRLASSRHEGVSGHRIDQHFATLGESVAAHRPDLILLHLGTNDVVQNCELTEAPARMQRLLEIISSNNPETRVLVALIIDANKASSEYGILAPRIRAFNRALAQALDAWHTAGLTKVSLADLSGAVTNPANYNQSRNDPVHPSVAGYEEMADAWFKTIVGLADFSEKLSI